MIEQKTGLEQPNDRKEITDRKVLGIIDASIIPEGYGIVDYDPENQELLVTNNTGDVRLFIDPETRAMSSMEIKEVESDAGAFFSGLTDLPEEYQQVKDKSRFPKKFRVTKSHEGTEFVHGIGSGNSPSSPIELVQKSTHTYKDVSVIHLALARTTQLRKTPLYASLNDILFTYTPNGSQVEISAAASFTPPRDFDAIEKDVKADKPIPVIEIFYYRYLLDNPDTFKDPIEWYREKNGTRIDIAIGMFERVKERIESKDF